MKKVLITGFGGYVATNLTNELESKGYLVKIIDLLDKGWKTISFKGFNVVIHTSALVHENEKKHTLSDYLSANSELTQEIAMKAKNEGVNYFIFMSSESVYSNKNRHPKYEINSQTPLIPKTKYGISKLDAEKKLLSLIDDSFKVLILRCPMIYGKGCKGNYNKLRNISLKYKIAPSFNNKKSLLFIGNLCSFIRHSIEIEQCGIRCPQDKNYHSTSGLMVLIGAINEVNVKKSLFVSLCLKLIMLFNNSAKKAFRSSFISYELSSLDDGFNYCIYDNNEAIKLTEGA